MIKQQELDREALSKKVIYPENRPFVLTGEGDIFPLDRVKERIREQAAKHMLPLSTNTILGLSLTGVLSLIVFVFCTVYLLSSVLSFDGRSLAAVPFLACMALLSLIFAVVWLRATYGIYRLKQSPEKVYVEKLMQGTLIVGHVSSVTRNAAGITDFTYYFDTINPTNPLQIQRHTETHHNETFKIVEEGDEVIILYSSETLHLVL